MPRFNPDFWETTIESAGWERFTAEDALWYQEPDSAVERDQRAERVDELWPAIREIIDETLTDRQREVVLLTYVEELNQRETAERLGITQQSVSEHLYGKVRNGRTVGGAIRKLRKACARRGFRWDRRD